MYYKKVSIQLSDMTTWQERASKRITIRLHQDLEAAALELAKQHGLGLSQFVNKLVKEQLAAEGYTVPPTSFKKSQRKQ